MSDDDKTGDPAAARLGELVLGLTENGEDTMGLSIVTDAHRELEALAELLGDAGSTEPLERVSVVTLLHGLSRRFRVGIQFVRRELPPREPERVQ